MSRVLLKSVAVAAAVCAAGQAGAQSVPNSAFFAGVGVGGNATNFSSQSIAATGTSTVYNTASGAKESSGSAGGPPINVTPDSANSFIPSAQLGYFQHFSGTPWLWGGKLTYAYTNASSTTGALRIPQYGSFGTTPFTGNAIARSFEASVNQRFALVPYVGYSFDKIYVYAGAGPTWSQIGTKVNDLVGFADIDGKHTDISGAPQSFSSSKWVFGGTAVVGLTYFFNASWFLDANYSFVATQSSDANYSSTFVNVSNPSTYTGSLIGSSTGSSTSQSFIIAVNRAF